ncbi:HU family DNA-binding protein [Actinomadura monticuli]|uniref:HU family DNA-binding protein n=1 Tax=Actinomadura monticuli TaxID=3097367 RepID=A0ABV4QH64_9ACTN
MNRSELVRTVAERAGSDEPAARRHVDAVFDTVMEKVSAGERVIVTGFGTFDSFSRPARSARNPRTGQPVEVPAAQVPRFRTGQTFRNRVAGSGPIAEPAAAEPAAAEAEAPATVPVEAPAPKRPKNAKNAKNAKDAGKAQAAGAGGKNGKKPKKDGAAKKPSANAEVIASAPAKNARPAQDVKGAKNGKAPKNGKKKAGKAKARVKAAK